jgi:hypothetical protein
MILDNLGLSAAEIKERMKEGGDMTTAVAAIIRDKMDEAGGYVETASDRMARSTAGGRTPQKIMSKKSNVAKPRERRGMTQFRD